MKARRDLFTNLIVLAGLIFAVSILATGCRPPFPQCRDADDCKAEEGNSTLMACCNGQCQECCADGDCPKERPRCKENRCVECLENSDCPEDKPFCEGEQCVYECEIDSDCVRRDKAGMICKEHKCQWECETDEDCNDPNKECKDHRCVMKCKCQSDEDCPEGQMCSNCECIDKPQCELETIHFDFNRYDLRSSDREILDKNVECMQKRSDITVTIEGHCDERGTTEYNINLGDKRAKATRKYMEKLGVPRSRLKTISYGEERPTCSEATESCWADNRRSEFKY